MNFPTLATACLLLTTLMQAFGQREVRDWNAAWEFKKSAPSSTEVFTPIHLPHTYNALDAFDDANGYYRGIATYQKIVNTSLLDRNKKHFLKFHAVNQQAKVFVNGQRVGTHLGGYTAFTIELTEHLHFEMDTLVVEVDNAHDPDVPPLRGDFTFYGGIYRTVEWISVAKTYFAMDQYGSDGVFIDPLEVTETKAKIRVRGIVKNFDTNTQEIKVAFYDPQRKKITATAPINYDSASGKWETIFQFNTPQLWSPNHPVLYTVDCNIINQADSKINDNLRIPYGLRYFSFDADQGFSINGKATKLVGVNRHQDRPLIGNALSPAQHLEDMVLLKDMGANFLRTAHYPQDQIILDICDHSGILVSMEIPLDHEITISPEFSNNSKAMTLEMIYQYYNHPSIIIWAYMNEMGLGKQIKRDSLVMTKVTELAQELEDLVRKEDPYRYTMIPNHGDFDIYHHFGLTRIPMIVGWNLYYGWYEPDFEGFGKFVDHAHQMVPDQAMMITEYGAGADPRLTSFAPERFDFSLDWTLRYHQSHLQQILDRPFIAGSAVWNMFDFGSESRQDAVPHINNKGLCGYDRKPKPVYHLYQAHLKKESLQKIAKLPNIILLPNEKTKVIPLTIVSNQETVELHHKEDFKKIKVVDYLATIPVNISEGKNIFSIRDGSEFTQVEAYTFDRYWQEKNILRINFGSNFYYTPTDGTSTWIPDSEVPAAFIKIIGGKRFQPRDRGVGSDRAIALTEDDPVYQTMLVALENIQLPLPSGEYTISLHFAQLKTDEYDQQSISINGEQMKIEGLSPFSARTISTRVFVNDTLTIAFEKSSKQHFINGIQILKL